MKLLLVALLPFASQAHSKLDDFVDNQVCYSGTIKIGTTTFTEEDIMREIWPQLNASVLTVANADPALSQFLKKSGNCQVDCLGIVMKPTLETLYGKLGKEFVRRDKDHINDLFVEALFGAFRACYPHPPRAEVRQVAEVIVAGIGTIPASKNLFPAGVTCPNEGREDDFPLADFLQSFEYTFFKVLENQPEMQKYFDTEAKDCQKTCLEKTVPASAMTLFLTDNANDDAGIDALTGAIHACFPGVPHEDINLLVSDTKNVMETDVHRAEAMAEAENGTGGFVWTYFNFTFFVVTLAVVLAGAWMAVSRWQNSSRRKYYQASLWAGPSGNSMGHVEPYQLLTA